MMWFLFSEDYYVFIEIIYVTDVHEVMLRTMIEFFVTDVMKEMNSFVDELSMRVHDFVIGGVWNIE